MTNTIFVKAYTIDRQKFADLYSQLMQLRTWLPHTTTDVVEQYKPFKKSQCMKRWSTHERKNKVTRNCSQASGWITSFQIAWINPTSKRVALTHHALYRQHTPKQKLTEAHTNNQTAQVNIFTYSARPTNWKVEWLVRYIYPYTRQTEQSSRKNHSVILWRRPMHTIQLFKPKRISNTVKISTNTYALMSLGEEKKHNPTQNSHTYTITSIRNQK